jgi:DNA invertase Pin-like site-specific DNA recombinase
MRIIAKSSQNPALGQTKTLIVRLGRSASDTTTAHGRLMLTVLVGLAEFERELIRVRTSEGRERSKARGVHMGRPPKMTTAQKREARQRRKDGESVADLARSYGVSPAAIYRTTAAA